MPFRLGCGPLSFSSRVSTTKDMSCTRPHVPNSSTIRSLSGFRSNSNKQEEKKKSKGCQVLNLGAGLDTRSYWLESLKKNGTSSDDDDDDDDNSTRLVYWEVDAAPVLDYKQGVLDALKAKGNLPDSLCPRKVITVDFSKDSILSLPEDHGFPKDLPTRWILEGLIMYLQQSDVETLLDNLTELSAKDSLLLLNYTSQSQGTRSQARWLPTHG